MHPLPGGRTRNYVYRMIPRHVALRLRLAVRRGRRFVVHHVLHADDPPHKLALGAAIGVWITFTPTIGLQMMLVVFFAWLFRANKVIGLPFVWITNPATVVPIYYPCYWLGRELLGLPDIGLSWWKELASPPPGWLASIQFYWERVVAVFEPLWLGCILVATVLAAVVYSLVYFGVRGYRLRRWGTIVPPAIP